MQLTIRNLLLLLWVGAIALIAIALYMQYVMELIPCALCMTQRVFIITVGIAALLAWLHKPGSTGLRVYSALGGLLAVLGGAFSIRHLWLQSLPEDMVPACGPSLSYLLEAFPISEALQILLRGDGNCAETVWSLFGITIPGWTLIAFIGLLLINCLVFYKSKQQ
jgi:disulfide bond formation protein DsbB